MKSKVVLMSWIGNTDLKAAQGIKDAGEGPIGQAVASRSFDLIVLLSDHSKAAATAYVKWLEKKTAAAIELRTHTLPSPTDFGAIYKAVVAELSLLRQEHDQHLSLVYHLSPGTPAMAAVWILVAKTQRPGVLIESSREQGVKEANIPFELSAEFFPTPDKQADEALTRLLQGMPPEAPAFSSIVHRCQAMKRTVAMAHRLALRDVPVLIQGESGTGKELFARAIHQASQRNGGPFIAVNCGAIPQELVDAELFGHEKGAFTGAGAARPGYFESANGGTLFLDEIGELPLASQVRLLRVLQEREVTRIGATKAKSIDIRVIAATNRVLPEEIRGGRFREDLFHRLAVGVLILPPLRQREGDLSLLIDSLLVGINKEASTQPGYKQKKLDVSARNLLMQHSWPGNVRELHNTLLRASIWATGDKITAGEVAESLAVASITEAETVLGRSLEHGVSLPEILEEVARHYLDRGMTQTHGNKSEAAKLLGLGSYQTLTNWLKKYQAI